VDEYLEYLEKLKGNRYKQVIIASKYAKILNDRLRRQRLLEQTGEGEKDRVQLDGKVTTQALKALLDGKIEYEDPDR